MGAGRPLHGACRVEAATATTREACGSFGTQDAEGRELGRGHVIMQTVRAAEDGLCVWCGRRRHSGRAGVWPRKKAQYRTNVPSRRQGSHSRRTRARALALVWQRVWIRETSDW
jgi:hypothetical protein